MKIFTGNVDWQNVAGIIRKDLEEYVRKYHMQALVLGISGGIDSALTAVLAVEVCDRAGIPLIGRSLTVETNGLSERRRAEAVGKAYCTDFRETDLTDIYETVRKGVEEIPSFPLTQDDKVRRGNIKARLRMIYLYNLAQQRKGMVLSTDNRTEYLLGFWTLHGDVGDYAPLFGLWKTEIYAMAETLAGKETDIRRSEALRACITAVPTDGLGISDSDLDQLGARTYEEVDDTLRAYLRGESMLGNPRVIGRHLVSDYKRRHPYVIGRNMLGLEE